MQIAISYFLDDMSLNPVQHWTVQDEKFFTIKFGFKISKFVV